jgi:VIT1/CCC1 family predicted Fe2+/Mn2+ transporter
MARLRHHRENHLLEHIGSLRAAVLGANDGIVSTASLIVGVAASNAEPREILVVGAAGLVAGAMSMAAGEYVSVSSQSDMEQAELAKEVKELREYPDAELEELAQIYIGRGLTPDLARQVAVQLTAYDKIGTHARDELGISEITAARPVQAAMASAASFAVGAGLPLVTVLAAPAGMLIPAVSVVSLALLLLLGAIGARAGGADPVKGAARVGFWGSAAMALTAGIGAVFEIVV